MQPTALDAEIGSEALALVRGEEEALSRTIRHAVVLTKTSAAMKSRVQRELETQLRGAGIDMIEPSLVARAAFSELFACGGDLTAMMNNPEIVTGGKVDKALLNGNFCLRPAWDAVRRPRRAAKRARPIVCGVVQRIFRRTCPAASDAPRGPGVAADHTDTVAAGGSRRPLIRLTMPANTGRGSAASAIWNTA